MARLYIVTCKLNYLLVHVIPHNVSNLILGFLSVPGDVITSASLSLLNPTATLGSGTFLTCKAILSMGISGAMIEFDFDFTNTSVAANFSTTVISYAFIPVTISSAGKYTCTVTATASGVCGGGGSEPACPTKTSDAVKLTVICEL